MKYFFLAVNTLFIGIFISQFLRFLYIIYIFPSIPCIYPLCLDIPEEGPSVGSYLYIPVVLNWVIYTAGLAISFLIAKKLLKFRIIALVITTISLFTICTVVYIDYEAPGYLLITELIQPLTKPTRILTAML